MALWDPRTSFANTIKEENGVEYDEEEEEEEEDDNDSEDKETEEPPAVFMTEPFQIPKGSKRKRLSRTGLKHARVASLYLPGDSKPSPRPRPSAKKSSCTAERWSVQRYMLAERNMLDILQAEGATFQNPITRGKLRIAARKYIGDTGLLDHLLKHIEGKTAPGGIWRFRRWHNNGGSMEYWLEDAGLADLRKRAGVQDPYWIPPAGGGDIVPAEEIELLKDELNKLKSEMQEQRSKKEEQDEQSRVGWQEMFKEMVKWKAETDQNLNVILSSCKSMQDMYEELMGWKAKLEQQLADVKSLLESKQHPALSPRQDSERWEEWLESSKLDDVMCNEPVPWFDNNNTLVNTEQEAAAMHGFYPLVTLPAKPVDRPIQCLAPARQLDRLEEEITNTNRGTRFHEAAARKEDHANVTPESCTSANSLPEFHPSSSLCQELFVEIFNWKAKMERKVAEISSCVNMTGHD